MIRLTSVKPARLTRSSIFSKFSYHCQLRNASTATASSSSKTKTKTPNRKATSNKGNSSQPTGGDYILSGRPLNQAWTIEPQVGYWNAKLRTPVSPGVIVLTISLAIGSIILTSLAFPDPSSLPTSSSPSTSAPSSGEDAPTPKPSKSILDILFLPVKFIYRPVIADEQARIEAQYSWKYWLGCAAGLSGLTIFTVSHFFTPRYIRLLTISPSLSPSSGASTSITRGANSGTLRIQPALGRTVTHPIRNTVLISPLYHQNQKGTRKVLTTIRIKGPNGALRGWGVNMFRDGAVVNGKLLRQQDVISLLERIWVQRGGKIDVGR